MVQCTSINQEILIWARKTAGYSTETIANDKNYKNIIDWEEGKKYPTYKQLKGLSIKYKVPIAVFFFPEPPKERQLEKKSFRTLPEYEINNLTPLTRSIIRKAQAIQINLKDINDNLNPSKKFVTKEFKINLDSPIVDNALSLRKYLGVSIEDQQSWNDLDNTFENWRDILTFHGIFVFKDAFKDDNIAGFCLYDPVFPLIFVNNSLPKTRQIFTLFHELAHLLFKNNDIDFENKKYLQSINDENKKIEIFCNKFAGEFLVPTTNFNLKTSKIIINENNITNLATLYNVSREVILRKFFDSERVSQEYYSEKSEKWRKEAKKERAKKKANAGGDFYNTHISYLGMNYLNLVFQKYNQKHISFDKALDCLNINAKSFFSLEERFSINVMKGIS